jgi:hypothetical protein
MVRERPGICWAAGWEWGSMAHGSAATTGGAQPSNKNRSEKIVGTGIDTVDRHGLNNSILAPMSRSNAGIYGTNL